MKRQLNESEEDVWWGSTEPCETILKCCDTLEDFAKNHLEYDPQYRDYFPEEGGYNGYYYRMLLLIRKIRFIAEEFIRTNAGNQPIGGHGSIW